MKCKEERKLGYDVLRIFACFGVIMNHSMGVYYDTWGRISVWKWFIAAALFCLCKMAVPFFLLLSGALLLKKDESYRNLLFKRILHTIFLIMAWSVIYGISSKERIVAACQGGFTWLLSVIRASVAVLPSWHMWYLYTILGIYFMLPFFRKMVAGMEEKDQQAFCLIWLVFGGLIPYYNSIFQNHQILLSNRFDIGFLWGYTAVFVMGYIIDRWEINKKRRYLAIICGSFAWIINVLMTYILSTKEQISTKAFDAGLAFPVLLTAYAVFYLITNFKLENMLGKTSKKIIEEISRCTLGVYLIHPLVMRWINHWPWFVKCFIDYPISVHKTLIVEMLFFAVSVLIIYMIRKVPVLNRIV